jgi:two-component system, LytTR family, sensor histidine kinase AlgZ
VWSRLLGYLLPAAALTVVFAGPGELGDPAITARRFLGYLLVGLCIALPAEGLGRLGHRWLVPERAPRGRKLALWVGVIVISTVVGGEIAVRLLHAMNGAPLAEMRAGVLRVGLVVCALVVTGSIVVDRLRRSERRAELAQKSALRAELAALQARTQPHFLFNGLNSVAALIEEEPVRAEAALLALARVYRYALDGSRRPSVPLAEELGAVRSYLEVETLRFADRLRIVSEIAPDSEAHPIAPLMLQPLVENAVLHGIANRVAGGTLRLLAAREGDDLVVRVESPLPERAPRPGTGTALADLSTRAALLGGSLTTGPVGDEFHAILRLPWRDA